LGRSLRHAASFVLIAVWGCAAGAHGSQIKSGHKAKVKGPIMSRDGDFMIVRDQKVNVFVVIAITDHTKIERAQKGFKFRHPDMDVTALVPGLTVAAEGVGNVQGRLDATKILFDPAEFGGETAAGEQIPPPNSISNTGSGGYQRVSTVATVQPSGVPTSQQVSYRVSDLSEYENVAQAGIYFAPGKTVLDAAARMALEKVADIALPLAGYLIEVAGYSAGTGSEQLDESLSAARAEAVAQYLLKKNIPIRRVLVPAGQKATHPDARSTDPEGRALSRRVDVTVLVNWEPGVRRAGL
jgi:outer membrane protein OmpA-like peptidoglycan-associated protein